jgi:type I restriction enzyme, S subunit
MNTYSSYKDSGIEWIGEIPSEWDVKRLDHFFTQRKDKVDDTMYPPLSVTMKGIKNQLEGVAKSDDNSNRKLVLKNDFVINSRSDRRGSSGVSFRDGSVSLINTVLEPKNINTDYVEYLLKSHYFIEEYFRFGKGIHFDLWSTNYSLMKNIKIPVLSEEEQQQIADYLDYKTSKIDSLIEKTQQKIELLKEQRTSLINTTVTKGLNVDVEMKDSGVEWIGEIPVEWDTTQIKFICKMMRGKFSHRPRNDQRFYDGEYPFIQTGDISSTGMYLTKFNQTLNERGFSVSKEFPIDTVVMTIAANIGDVSILKIRSCFPDSIIGFHPYHDMSVKYLYYILTSLKDELHKNSTVSTQMNLNVERVGSIKIPLSTVQEQQQIVDYLDKETLRIDKLVDIESKRIILLKEYRQSLISDVVTGKVDVRDEVLV